MTFADYYLNKFKNFIPEGIFDENLYFYDEDEIKSFLKSLLNIQPDGYTAAAFLVTWNGEMYAAIKQSRYLDEDTAYDNGLLFGGNSIIKFYKYEDYDEEYFAILDSKFNFSAYCLINSCDEEFAYEIIMK